MIFVSRIIWLEIFIDICFEIWSRFLLFDMCRQIYYLKRFHLSMAQIMDPMIEMLQLLMGFVGFWMLPSTSCHLNGLWLCLLTELNLFQHFGILWSSVMRTKNGHHTSQMMHLVGCYLLLYSVLSTSKTFCTIVLFNAYLYGGMECFLSANHSWSFFFFNLIFYSEYLSWEWVFMTVISVYCTSSIFT